MYIIYISVYVCSCLIISIYIYLYLFISISIYLYLFISIYICLYLFISIYIYLYLCISIYIYLYLYIFMYIYIFINIYMYIYLFIYVYKYIYMYAHVCMVTLLSVPPSPLRSRMPRPVAPRYVSPPFCGRIRYSTARIGPNDLPVHGQQAVFTATLYTCEYATMPLLQVPSMPPQGV